MKAWIGLDDIRTSEWTNMGTMEEWWNNIALKRSPNRKEMTSLMMLISWEVWKQRNARVFRNIASPTMIIVGKIKEEAQFWVIAGARDLSDVLARE